MCIRDSFQALVKTSRLETGVIQLDKKPGRLFDTVAQAMSGIVYAAEKKEIAVSVDCPEDLKMCIRDSCRRTHPDNFYQPDSQQD